APKSDRVPIGHFLLGRGGSPAIPAGTSRGVGGRGARIGARPMEIENDINSQGGTIGDQSIDDTAIIDLVGATAAEPVILVDRQADHVAMPSRDGLGNDTLGVPPVARGWAFAVGGKFQSVHID